jgi:hypothetical protein
VAAELLARIPGNYISEAIRSLPDPARVADGAVME